MLARVVLDTGLLFSCLGVEKIRVSCRFCHLCMSSDPVSR